MSDSLTSVGAITLFVEDVRLSRAFYEKTFDLPTLFEDEDEDAAAFKFENTIVNLLQVRAAHKLIDPAPVARGVRKPGHIRREIVKVARGVQKLCQAARFGGFAAGSSK